MEGSLLLAAVMAVYRKLQWTIMLHATAIGLLYQDPFGSLLDLSGDIRYADEALILHAYSRGSQRDIGFRCRLYP